MTLTLHVFGSTLLKLLPITRNTLLRVLTGIVDFRFFLLLFLQSGVFMLIFAFLPNGRNRLRDTVPGALLASLGWQIFSALFSHYVEHWTGYSNVYGSVYAVAMGMLWLYFCMAIVFYGGVLNRLLME